MPIKHNKKIYKNQVVVSMVILVFILGIIIYIVIFVNNNLELTAKKTLKQDYNYNVKLANKQKILAQGYKLIANIPDNIKTNIVNTYKIRITNKNQAITNASVVAYFYHSNNKKYDFYIPLKDIDNGDYQSKIQLTLKGVWKLIIKIKKDDYLQISTFDLLVKNN